MCLLTFTYQLSVHTMELGSDTIKSWLEVALANHDVADLAVEIVGKTAKSDGYLGHVLFVHVTGRRDNGDATEYHLVLKCGKQGETYRQSLPVRDAFLNEIYFYEKILPAFNRFERKCGIKEPFNSVPKFYGKFVSDTMEVIALENLKKAGYEMWDSCKPLDRKHLGLIVEEYAKFHAISATMQIQEPKQYQELCNGLIKTWPEFLKSGILTIYQGSVEAIHDLLQGIVDETILARLLKLKDQSLDILTGTQLQSDALKIIIDGDCWNNNFMHRFGDGKELSSKVALLDWQIVMLGSPIFDLSYFLFSCISKADIEDMDAVLKHYHHTFSSYVRQLGSDPEELYPFKKFSTEWKQYGRYGVIVSLCAVKVSSINKDQAVDFEELAEQGQDCAVAILNAEVADSSALKDRVQYIVEYAADNDLLP